MAFPSRFTFYVSRLRPQPVPLSPPPTDSRPEAALPARTPPPKPPATACPRPDRPRRAATRLPPDLSFGFRLALPPCISAQPCYTAHGGEAMARPPRSTYPHTVHPVTLRCNHREFLFEPASFELSLSVPQETRRRLPQLLFDHCLMANHVHLLFQAGTAVRVGRAGRVHAPAGPRGRHRGSRPARGRLAARAMTRASVSDDAGTVHNEPV